MTRSVDESLSRPGLKEPALAENPDIITQMVGHCKVLSDHEPEIVKSHPGLDTILKEPLPQTRALQSQSGYFEEVHSEVNLRHLKENATQNVSQIRRSGVVPRAPGYGGRTRDFNLDRSRMTPLFFIRA